MHKRMGLRRLYRELVREPDDLSFHSERSHTMGLLSSAQKQRRAIIMKRDTPEKSAEPNSNKLPPSKIKSTLDDRLLASKMAATSNAYKPTPRSRHQPSPIPKKKQPREMKIANKAQPQPLPSKESRWGKDERNRLNDLYWEIGRPKRKDSESMNHLLKLYARRHRVVYRERTEEEIMERVKHQFRYNLFQEPNEKLYWESIGSNGKT